MFRERVCTVGEDILLGECNGGVGTRVVTVRLVLKEARASKLAK
jgi:hypothetical protein